MKIEKEPLGLGAVVRDRDGFLWLSNRFDADIEWSMAWWCCDLAEWRDWSAIKAVSVLNDGVVITSNGVKA